MIPSDQFVRFYNEVFKYLDSIGSKELRKYYDRVSANQEYHCMELFSKEKLQGMYKYWEHIRIEENCDMAHRADEECYRFEFFSCPSLSKALDNDAGACRKYCLHCPGWTCGIYRKAGLYQVFALMGLDDPQCCEWIYDDQKAAEAKYRELAAVTPPDELFTSFPPPA